MCLDVIFFFKRYYITKNFSWSDYSWTVSNLIIDCMYLYLYIDVCMYLFMKEGYVCEMQITDLIKVIRKL